MGAPRKAFYPWLMDMPALTPEARQYIEGEANRRISAGTDALTAGQADLHHARAASSPATLQDAAARLGEALKNVESGAAALRVLDEGGEPRQPGSAARPNRHRRSRPRPCRLRLAGPGII